MTIDDIIMMAQTFFQELGSNPLFIKYGLVGLFLNGALASTALPLPTEFAMSALLAGGYDRLSVFLTLAAGSVTGGFGGYFLGRSGRKILSRYSSKTSDEEKGHGYLAKYGWIAIFLAPWIPVLGDIIHMAAGAKKYDLRNFAIIMAAGKVVRVGVTVYLGSIILARMFGGA